MPSSARAHTTATSARVPFVIQVFSPFSTQPSPSLRAFVRMPAGFEPKSGSVSPKQPVLDIRHARAAVPFEVGAEKPEPAHLRDQLARETGVAEAIANYGQHT